MRSLATKPMRHKGPTADIPEAHAASSFGDLGGPDAAGVGGGNNGAGTDSGNAMDRNLVSFEHFENSRVRNAAGETTA